MPIRDDLEYLLANVEATSGDRFAGEHPFVARLASSFRESVEAVVGDVTYKVEGSAGKGVWANIPWLCVFDRLITETATRGFYVVYLIRRDGAGAFLSLNQATTEIREQVKGGRYLEVLRDTATRDVGLLAAEETGDLIVGPIDLVAATALAKGYEAGNIVALHYAATDLPSEAVLEVDLTRFLLLYTALIEGRATVGAEEPLAPGAPQTGIEAKRYRWHLRAERSRSLAKRAKDAHGDRCQVCDRRMADTYGEIGDGYIEAHHLKPFAGLDGRPTNLDPVRDFAVLCPNCHAMAHRGPPYTVSELRERIGSDVAERPQLAR
jgi:5-methylcytosine-specific restriction protein A